MSLKNKERANIKLIALDIDGTILDGNGTVSEANQEAIRLAQEKGIYIVLSTGRSLITCQHIAESLNISSYLITANGSEIWDFATGNLVERHLIAPERIQMMWDLAHTHQINFWTLTTEKVWREEFPNDPTIYEWLKFGYDTPDDDLRHMILEKLKQYDEFELSNSSPTNIEVNAKGVNKGTGLLKVCQLLGISVEEVMAIGDSLNDISMIKEAGYGIAMGNAQEIVKETANWTTATNKESGVAKAIHHWVL